MKYRPNILRIDSYMSEKGIDNFRFEMLVECSVDSLSDSESKIIEKMSPRFNLCKSDKDMMFCSTEDCRNREFNTLSAKPLKGKKIICREIPNMSFTSPREFVLYVNSKYNKSMCNSDVRYALNESPNHQSKGFHLALIDPLTNYLDFDTIQCL